MQSIAREHGGKCLSKEFIDLYAPLEWMCAKGHTWDAPYYIMRQGGWCRQCAIHKEKEERLEELREVAKERGGKCLSSIYINSWTKLQWQCKEKHVWEAKPNNIIHRHSWCPYCAGVIKHTIEQMQSIATQRNGKCLSTNYKSNKVKLTWQCDEGHTWKASPHAILIGQWCPRCMGKRTAEKLRANISDIKILATKRGGKLLSGLVHKCTHSP